MMMNDIYDKMNREIRERIVEQNLQDKLKEAFDVVAEKIKGQDRKIEKLEQQNITQYIVIITLWILFIIYEVYKINR